MDTVNVESGPIQQCAPALWAPDTVQDRHVCAGMWGVVYGVWVFNVNPREEQHGCEGQHEVHPLRISLLPSAGAPAASCCSGLSGSLTAP